ncbi:hypothetical protein [Glaciimonas sp. GG7]
MINQLAVRTINRMEITFNILKRNKTLEERGLDFADCGDVFKGKHLTVEDT